VLISAKNVRIAEHLANPYAHLVENHYVDSILGFDPTILDILSRDVLNKIKEQDLLWEQMVPTPVVQAIKRRGLFGHPLNLALAEPIEDRRAMRNLQ
jgi:hypothetical protein